MCEINKYTNVFQLLGFKIEIFTSSLSIYYCARKSKKTNNKINIDHNWQKDHQGTLIFNTSKHLIESIISFDTFKDYS